MTIDWSKAPEGATHWDMGLDGAVAGWMRVNEGQWYWWPVDGARCERKWHVCLTPKQPKSDKYIARPWNDEGLPPVGVDALLKSEHKLTEGTRLESFPAGTSVYVGGHANFGGCDLAVIIIKGTHFCGTIVPHLLEPVRTAEQIEAEERECAVTDMCVLLGKDPSRAGVRAMAGVLYEAGYRKQVAP